MVSQQMINRLSDILGDKMVLVPEKILDPDTDEVFTINIYYITFKSHQKSKIWYLGLFTCRLWINCSYIF